MLSGRTKIDGGSPGVGTKNSLTRKVILELVTEERGFVGMGAGGWVLCCERIISQINGFPQPEIEWLFHVIAICKRHLFQGRLFEKRQEKGKSNHRGKSCTAVSHFSKHFQCNDWTQADCTSHRSPTLTVRIRRFPCVTSFSRLILKVNLWARR